MAGTNNSLNINSSGVVVYDASTGAFTESLLTIHDVLVGGAANALVSVTPSTANFVLTSNGVSADPSFKAISASGAITTVTGDAGSMTPTAGSVAILGGSTGLTTSASSSTMNMTGTLNVGHGGTGLAAMTTYELLAGGTTSTGVLQQVGAGTSGQVLYSNGSSSLPSFGAAPVGISWVDVTSSTQAIAANTGYVTDNATQVTYTLPASAAFGEIFEITGGALGAATAPWKLEQNALQIVNFGASATTPGTGGSITSTLQFDSIRVVCVVADTQWNVLSSVGNLAVV